MIICPYCGHQNDDKATNCEKCRGGLPHEENKNNDEPRRVRKKDKE